MSEAMRRGGVEGEVAKATEWRARHVASAAHSDVPTGA